MFRDSFEITVNVQNCFVLVSSKSGSHKIRVSLISCFLVIVFTVIAIALKIPYTKLKSNSSNWCNFHFDQIKKDWSVVKSLSPPQSFGQVL